MEVTLSMFFVVVFLWLLVWYVVKKVIYDRGLPPGPNGLPFIGYIPWLSNLRFDTVTNIGRKYNGIWSAYFGTQLNIYLDSYDSIKEAMADPVFSGRVVNKFSELQTHNCGVMFTEGHTWKVHRRLCLRALRDVGFARNRSVQLIMEEVRHMFEEIDHAIEEGKSIETMETLSIASNSVISTLIFGSSRARDDDDLKATLRKFRTFLSTDFLGALPFLFPFTNNFIPILKHVRSLKMQLEILQSLVDCVVKYMKERQLLLEKGMVESECVCDTFLIEKQKYESRGDFETFKDFQLIRVFMEFFFAGTDTTASTLQFAVLFMAVYPEVQSQVQAEIDKQVGDRMVTCDDRLRLHYTNAVIAEIFRLSSIAPLSVAHRATSDTLFRGYRIPHDAIINININAVHTNPKYWKYPNEFNPKNFLDSNDEFVPSQYLIPFNIGMRSCPGESLARMEVFLFFASLIQRYTVVLPEEFSTNTTKLLAGSYGIIRSPAFHKIKFTKRRLFSDN